MSIRINGTNYDSTIDQTFEEAGQVYYGARHLAANPELYMPQGTNHFYFYVDFDNDGDITGTLKFAGKWSFDGGTIEVLDWIGANTKEILMKWQAKSGNIKTDKVGLASDYKKTAYLVETTPDGQRVRAFKMYGCWISGLSEDAHNYDNSDSRAISATITYDYAELDED